MSDRHRALVVAYNFPPNAMVGTMRTLRLVERLASDGWDVRVLTVSPRSYGGHEPVDPELLDRIPASVRVTAPAALRPVTGLQRVVRRFVAGTTTRKTEQNSVPPAMPRATSQPTLLRRAIDLVDLLTTLPDQEAGWITPAVLRGAAMGGRWRPHVLYTTAPPWSAQVIGYSLSQLLRCPWVADFRDPWARGPWREHRPALTMRVWQALEHRVVRRASAVVLNTRRIRREFIAYYGEAVAAKFHVIPNGCDAAEIAALGRTEATGFELLHAGSLYGGRSPLTLIRAMALARDRGELPLRFKLVLLGAVPDAAALALARQLGLEGAVEYGARVSRHEGLSRMVAASALLLLQQGHELSVPAKAYEYLATGRPILALTDDGETGDLIRESGAGVVAAGDDVEGVRRALAAVVALARTGIARVPLEACDGRSRAGELATLMAALVPPSARVHVSAVADEQESGHVA